MLTRNPSAARAKLTYPGLEFYGTNEWARGVEGATGVVNLAGEPIATRWGAACCSGGGWQLAWTQAAGIGVGLRGRGRHRGGRPCGC